MIIIKKIGRLIVFLAILYTINLNDERVSPIITYLPYQESYEKIKICSKKEEEFYFINLDYSENKIDEAFQYLTMKANCLPLEFKTHLPYQARLLDYDLQNETLSLNVSKEFLLYKEEDDFSIARELFFSYYEQGIKKLFLYVEGEKLNQLGQIDISMGIDQNIGINHQIIASHNSKSIIIYYTYDEYIYPVTYVVDKNVNEASFIINSLFSFYERGEILDVSFDNNDIIIKAQKYTENAKTALKESLKGYYQEITFHFVDNVLSS